MLLHFSQPNPALLSNLQAPPDKILSIIRNRYFEGYREPNHFFHQLFLGPAFPGGFSLQHLVEDDSQ